LFFFEASAFTEKVVGWLSVLSLFRHDKKKGFRRCQKNWEVVSPSSQKLLVNSAVLKSVWSFFLQINCCAGKRFEKADQIWRKCSSKNVKPVATTFVHLLFFHFKTQKCYKKMWSPFGEKLF
jgi:hypothetical protein